MDRESYNPDDPCFLLSRRLDNDLSPREHEQIEGLLRASPQLQRQAGQLGAVHRLVARWGQRPAEPNPASAPASEADLATVDALLRRWGRRAVPSDDVGLPDRVLAEIRGGGRIALTRRLIFRLGVPLAAAASLALAVVGTTWFQPARVCQVTVGPLPVAAADRLLDVSFAPFVAEPPPIPQTRASFGYMTLGAETLASADEGSSL